MKRTRFASCFALALGLLDVASGCSGGSAAGSGGGSLNASSASSATSATTATSATSAAGTGGASASSAAGTGGNGGAAPDPYVTAVKSTNWVKLANGPTVTGGAKQDDVFFLDANAGFLASGPTSTIFATKDGGMTWSTSFMHAGTYFRGLLFTDAQHGFAGNIGAGLSASITDATLLYTTANGGATWAPVTTVTGSAAQGVCNFTAVDATHLVAVGRANGPASLLQSSDGGATWAATDLSSQLSMVIDAHFFSATEGLLAGMDASATYCTILRTTDGGTTFDPVFTSKTSGSLCWKLHFPSAQIGYAAVQDTAAGPGTFAKTTDGGQTWTELPLPGKPTGGLLGDRRRLHHRHHRLDGRRGRDPARLPYLRRRDDLGGRPRPEVAHQPLPLRRHAHGVRRRRGGVEARRPGHLRGRPWTPPRAPRSSTARCIARRSRSPSPWRSPRPRVAARTATRRASRWIPATPTGRTSSRKGRSCPISPSRERPRPARAAPSTSATTSRPARSTPRSS